MLLILFTYYANPQNYICSLILVTYYAQSYAHNIEKYFVKVHLKVAIQV